MKKWTALLLTALLVCWTTGAMAMFIPVTTDEVRYPEGMDGLGNAREEMPSASVLGSSEEGLRVLLSDDLYKPGTETTIIYSYFDADGEYHYVDSVAGKLIRPPKTDDGYLLALPVGGTLAEVNITRQYVQGDRSTFYTLLLRPDEASTFYSAFFNDASDETAFHSYSYLFDSAGELILLSDPEIMASYQHGAIVSYTYDVEENFSMQYSVDAEPQATYTTPDATYFWQASEGWTYVPLGSTSEIPCEKPEGAPDPAAVIPPLNLTTTGSAEQTDATWFPYNTLNAAGVSLKDLGISDNWRNVLPVEFREGVQTYPLLASNAFMIGTVSVTVADGNVTVDYHLLNGEIYLKQDSLTWFLSPAEITDDALEPLGAYTSGQPVDIAKELGGAPAAILYINGKVTFRQPFTNDGEFLPRYYRTNPNWVAYRESLQAILERLPALQPTDAAPADLH